MREFIGYENIISNFERRNYNKTLSHAYLISGQNGSGKSILAEKLAKLMIDAREDREYIDIMHYKSSKSSFGVDDVRNIIEEIQKKPYENDKKVVIIHEGDKLTIQAQNALLKTIEEPPNGVHIILLCENLELILDTIKSRCEIYKLTPLSKKELSEYIEIYWNNKNEEEKKSAIAFSFGVPGRIDRYFQDNELQSLRYSILDLLDGLTKNNIEFVLKKEEEFSSIKNNNIEILDIMFSFIRDILVYKEVDNDDLIINNDKIKEISELAINMSFKKLNNMISNIEEAKRNIKSNVNWNTVLRLMLMSFMEG